MSHKDTVFDADLYQFSEIREPSLVADNSVHTLCLARYGTAIPSADPELCQKILQAVGVQAAQSRFIDLAVQCYPLSAFRRIYPLQYAIGFGITLSDMGLSLRLAPYTPFIPQGGGLCLLLADSLAVIAADKSKKAVLWNALQAMYGIGKTN